MSGRHDKPPSLTLPELEAVYRKVDPYYASTSGGQRLRIAPKDWEAMVAAGKIEIPEGQWSITDHPNRLKAKPGELDPIYGLGNPVPTEQTELWRAQGLLVDTVGRALHPRAKQVLTGPGMFTQPGAHFGYGPQQIVNCGLRRVRNGVAEYPTVWVDRGEAQLRGSLPGGYVDKGETVEQAMARELLQETGIELNLAGLALRQLVIPPHPYWKNTLHAWTEESFVFVRAESVPGLALPDELHTQDPDEVRHVGWMSVDEINLHPGFLGAHREQILTYEAQR